MDHLEGPVMALALDILLAAATCAALLIWIGFDRRRPRRLTLVERIVMDQARDQGDA